MSKPLASLCVTVIFVSLTLPSGSQSQTVPRAAIQLRSLDEVLGVRVLYQWPEVRKPRMVLRSKDTIDVSMFAVFNTLNRSEVYDIEKRPGLQDRFERNLGIQSQRQIGRYLVCLTEANRGKDILLWQKQGSRFTLLAIHPCEVGVCLYCDPDFHTISADTFSIGFIAKDMEDVYGGYSYYTVIHDSLRPIRSIVANGTDYFDKGALCVSYLTTLYDSVGLETQQSIRYEYRDRTGKDIVALAIKDSLALFKMYWQGVGPEVARIQSPQGHFRVGGSSYSGRRSLIAIEYKGSWFWTLSDDVAIQ